MASHTRRNSHSFQATTTHLGGVGERERRKAPCLAPPPPRLSPSAHPISNPHDINDDDHQPPKLSITHPPCSHESFNRVSLLLNLSHPSSSSSFKQIGEPLDKPILRRLSLSTPSHRPNLATNRQQYALTCLLCPPLPHTTPIDLLFAQLCLPNTNTISDTSCGLVSRNKSSSDL